MPFHCDDDRTDKWSYDTLDELMRYANSADETDKTLVEVVPAISFKGTPKDPPSWATDPRAKVLGFQRLSIDQLYNQRNNFRLPKRELMDEAGYQNTWLFHTPIVDSPNMLKVSSNPFNG